MAKKIARTLKKAQKRRANGQVVRVARNIASSYEHKLLEMIMDPCGSDLTPGLGLSATGICQRFTSYISFGTVPENTFSFFFNPNSQQPFGGYTFRGSTGANIPTYFLSGPNPGESFLEANAEACSVLGYCVELLYVGPLVNRQGFAGVCQAPWASLTDVVASSSNPNTLIPYCQATQPVLAEAISVKYIPALNSFTANSQMFETSGNTLGNGIMVILSNVNLAHFVIKITSCYEYIPKATTAWGVTAPRPTKSVSPGTAERVVSTLDRMGHWWHNLGNAAAAANRLGGQFVYGAGQVNRFLGNVARVARPAASLLALAG